MTHYITQTKIHLLTCVFLLFNLQVFPQHAFTEGIDDPILFSLKNYQNVNVSINPANYTADPLESFTLDIVLGPVNNLMAFATEILFDPSVLTITNITESGFLKENGNVQTTFMKTIDNTDGKCIIAITRLTNPSSGVSTASGGNVVATLHIKANNAGSSAIVLVNTGLIMPDGHTTYDANVSNGNVNVEIHPDHSTVSFEPSSIAVFPEESFYSTIGITNADNIFAVAFDIHYDPAHLSINSISEGSFMNSNGQVSTVFITDINNDTGRAVVGITRLNTTTGESTGEGPRNLISINFQSKESGLTEVRLSDLGLLAPDGATNYPVLSEKLNVQVKADEAFIFGTLTHEETGAPIQGVVVKASRFQSRPSNAQGQYLLKVPYGYGYELEFISGRYEAENIPEIHVPVHDPHKQIDVQMTPIPIYYDVVNLVPNPNPTVSEVMQGGTLHRHYRVINTYNNHPLPFVPVRVSGSTMSRVFESDENGMIRISINSQQIGIGFPGAGDTFSMVSINNEQLDNPKSFEATVTHRKYSRYWDGENYLKLGGNILGFDVDEIRLSLGGITTLNVDEQYSFFPEELHINRQGRAAAKFGFKIKSPGFKGELGPIKGGAMAEAGAGISFTGFTEDEYLFGYESENNYQKIAKYILIADGNFTKLDNTLIRLLTICEWLFSSETTLLESNAANAVGVEIGHYAEAGASIGIDAIETLKIGAGADIGVESNVGVRLRFNHIDQKIESSFRVSGEFATGAKAGLKMDLGSGESTDNLSAMLKVWDTGYRRGLEFEEVRNYDNMRVDKYRLTVVTRNLMRKFEERLIFEISGEQVIDAIRNLTSEITQLSDIHMRGSNIRVDGNTFQKVIVLLFNMLYDIQVDEDGSATINYAIEKTDITRSSSFDVSIEASGTVLAGKFGGGSSFEEGKTMTIEEGKLAWGRMLKNQEYTGAIPIVPVEYKTLMQKVITETPWHVRSLMGDYRWIFGNKSDNTINIADNGSFIKYKGDVFPSDTDSIVVVSWSWFGGSPSAKSADLSDDHKAIFIKNQVKAEKLYGMQYGYGGFYQFEPYGLLLKDTCMLTIKYDPDEVRDIDVNSLAVYWEDKENQQWIYIGGVVDTLNHSVTAPIIQLGLFTLAPSSPFGSFGLHVLPDSIPADGESVATIVSDPVFNNNLQPVKEGDLFTVQLSHGSIVTDDANPALNGLQVPINDGKLTFQVRSTPIATDALVRVSSIDGSAAGSTTLVYYDTIPPSSPELINALPGDRKVQLRWNPNEEPDISGYRIYYDTDTLPPFNGIHTIHGQPSPIILGVDTLRNILGLFNDTIYYFAISAYDISGNESALSSFVSAAPASSFTVSVAANPAEAGIVKGSGAYKPWSDVSVSAVANENWYFVNWTESNQTLSGDSIFDFKIYGNRNLVANFLPVTRLDELNRNVIHAFPNPATTFVSIFFEYPVNNAVSLRLLTMQGQILLEKKHTPTGYSEYKFTLEGVPLGIYLLQIIGENINTTKKIIVNPR